MPGITQSQDFPEQSPKLPISSFGSPSQYSAGASQQASDYDTIMKQYQDLAKSWQTNPMTATSVTPQLAPYSQSADVTSGLSKLSDLATTGGYSAGDIADIRARRQNPQASYDSMDDRASVFGQ